MRGTVVAFMSGPLRGEPNVWHAPEGNATSGLINDLLYWWAGAVAVRIRSDDGILYTFQRMSFNRKRDRAQLKANRTLRTQVFTQNGVAFEVEPTVTVLRDNIALADPISYVGLPIRPLP